MELRTPAAFNKSIEFYDKLAQFVFGGAIRKSQLQLLSFIPVNASILIMGGGTGWILRDLAQLDQPLQITYLEASAGMLAKAQHVAEELPPNFLKIYFRQGSETALKPTEHFDIIFTPFVLDLYPEEHVWQIINYLFPYLNAGGLWLLADFIIAPTQKNWTRWWQLKVTRLMYTFFKWVEGLTTNSLPNLPDLFKKLSLVLLNRQTFFQGFIQSHVYQKPHVTPG